MKNITVAVPDEIYRRARIRAAQAGTSVSKLVTDFLWSMDDRALALSDAAAAREAIAARVVGFRASDRLDRDEIHDRAALR